MRTAQFRYTEWAAWNGATQRPNWSVLAGRELYDHSHADNNDFDATENCPDSEFPAKQGQVSQDSFLQVSSKTGQVSHKFFPKQARFPINFRLLDGPKINFSKKKKFILADHTLVVAQHQPGRDLVGECALCCQQRSASANCVRWLWQAGCCWTHASRRRTSP